jgi:hypothetical protein
MARLLTGYLRLWCWAGAVLLRLYQGFGVDGPNPASAASVGCLGHTWQQCAAQVVAAARHAGVGL